MTIPAKKLFEEWMSDPSYRDAYEAREHEVALIGAMVEMRRKARLSQREHAAKMGVSQPTLAKLEAGMGNPTWETICNVARAAGYRPKLAFVKLVARSTAKVATAKSTKKGAIKKKAAATRVGR